MPRAVTESTDKVAVRCLAVVTAALVVLAVLAVVVMAQRAAPRVVLPYTAPLPTQTAQTGPHTVHLDLPVTPRQDPDALADRADMAAQQWTGTDAGLITTPAQ